MMPNPRVSVILPAKNCGASLKEAVASVLSQTFDDFELIVVDDGTGDGSIDPVRNIDPRLRVIENTGAGLVDALNTGAIAARGKYLARMDGDDFCAPERFEKQVALLERDAEVGITATQVEVFGDEAGGEGYRLYERWVNSLVTSEDIRREMFVESPLPHPSVMMRADVFRALGGYRDMGWPEDYDLWLRAYEAGVTMEKVPEMLLRWRDTAARHSKTDTRYSKENFMRCRAHFLARAIVRDKDAVIWGAGKTGALLSKLLLAEGARIYGFIDINPRKIGKEKRGRPVFSPEQVAEMNGRPLLVAVAARAARGQIRGYLNERGKVEGADYYCVV